MALLYQLSYLGILFSLPKPTSEVGSPTRASGLSYLGEVRRNKTSLLDFVPAERAEENFFESSRKAYYGK